MKSKTLIIEPGGGLGNRILAISSAYNLAKDCGITDILLLWRDNNECGCEFEDVLEKLPIPTKVHTMHFGKESYKELLKKGKFFSVLYKFFQMLAYRGFRMWSKKVQLPIYQDMPSEEKRVLKQKTIDSKGRYIYIEAYYEFYGELDLGSIIFNSEIVRKYKAFKERMGNYDAMHIRRTDNVAAIRKSPTKLFYDKIEELGEQNIYIATDDIDILEDLKSKYPDRIYSEASTAVSRSTSEGIKFALYEMLILSGAETLYASYGSTFTKIANAIGNNRMETLTVE